MEVVPLNMEALQNARKRLQGGGTVLTGIDRPIGESDHEPKFFGRKAPLPVAYVKLAQKTNARVFVLGFQTMVDGTIVVDVSPQVEFDNCDNSDKELVCNAEKVLKIAEQFIRIDPNQWMMFLPVWPDANNEVPTI
jgi:lauroyl/myristoyl acyltransferase